MVLFLMLSGSNFEVLGESKFADEILKVILQGGIFDDEF